MTWSKITRGTVLLVCLFLLPALLRSRPPVPTTKPRTRIPFTYIIDYERGQATDAEFRRNFDQGVPRLYHPGSDLRYLGRFGFGGMVEDSPHISFAEYQREIRDYVDYLHHRGVAWITPYLCNQTISGNDSTRYGAWEIYDGWDKHGALGLGPKPGDPLGWMQREPSGNLHYNYKRMVFLERGYSAEMIRYAPCPNNPDWRRICNNEARLAADAGLDGLFIDNCIIHCYCQHCEARFQAYLKKKYTPSQLGQAFGTGDYDRITLFPEGDHVVWARSSIQFIPWLESRYTPDRRRIDFDTRGPLDALHVDNAGGGVLTGQAWDFIATHELVPGVRPGFENVRLANPALQNPRGRLRWAETMMFWSYSIGEMLAEMRDAGRSVNPDFFVMPNWGTMQRVVGACGRAEEGHDIKRWKQGADWQMYEEGFATGLVAPGLVLDYDMELRFALANGVRGMLLPYTLAGRDVAEVALAETAGSGGSVFVMTHFSHPDLIEEYQALFDRHPELYDGLYSAARVALAHFFDQTYFYNTEHIRQVHALNRFLADQQVLFDHILEEDLTAPRLAHYSAVILPNLAFVDDDEIAVLQSYLDDGGTVVIIGEFGAYDLYCRRRDTTSVLRTSGRGKAIRFRSLTAALPQDGIYLEPGIQATRGGEFSKAFEDNELAQYQYLAALDERLWFKRYQKPGPLTEAIAPALDGWLHLLDPVKASGVRVTAFTGAEGKHTRLVIHLMNKNLPLAVPEVERRLQPVNNLRVMLPIPAGANVTEARLLRPGEREMKLQVDGGEGGRFAVTIPVLGAYGMVSVVWE